MPAHGVDRVKSRCATCKEEFEHYPSAKRTYCSPRCHLAAPRPTFTVSVCEKCQQEFRHPRRHHRRFCGPKCAAAAESNLMTKACAKCGQPVTRRVSDLQTKRVVFCDKHCKAAFQSHPQKRCCAECQRTFYKKPSKPGVFCSAKCLKENWEKRWLEVECLKCQKSFRALKSFPKKYCSPRCYAQANAGEQSRFWKGGREPYYGKSWGEARRQARARDRVCQNCGITPAESGEALSVHHLIPFRRFGRRRHEEANVLSNLVCFCRVCHAIIENQDQNSK